MNATKPDPAAELGAAMSLYQAGVRRAEKNGNDLSAAYQGHDEFMRVCMNIARSFEAWCCRHVDWNVGIADCWPYLLQDRFGDLAIGRVGSECHLHSLQDKGQEAAFRKIARQLKLPLYRK